MNYMAAHSFSTMHIDTHAHTRTSSLTWFPSRRGFRSAMKESSSVRNVCMHARTHGARHTIRGSREWKGREELKKERE